MEQLQRYAWVLGVFGLLVGIAFGSFYFVLRDFTPWTTGLGVATIVLLTSYLVLDRDNVGTTVSSRQFAYGTGSVLMMVVSLCIALASYTLAKQYDKRWDLTGNQTFTLSESTLKVLAGLEEDVTIYAFFESESVEQRRFRDLTKGYSAASSHVDVQFTDPLRNPIVAQQFGITSEYGTVVLKQGEAQQRIESDFEEEKLTDAIVRLVSGEEHQLCWSVGHGERDPDSDMDAEGYGVAVVKLEGRNYKISKVSVATEGVPRACEALIVVDPQVDWMPYEREAMAAYVAEGGKVLVAVDLSTGAIGFLEDMERFGVFIGDDVAWDPSPGSQMMGMDPSVVLLTEDNYKPHEITQPLSAMAVLGQSRSVQRLKDAEGLRVRLVAETTDAGWAETDLASSTPVYDMEADLLGPVPLIVAIEVEDPGALGVAKPSEDGGPADPPSSEPELPDKVVQGAMNLERVVNDVLKTGEDDKVVIDPTNVATYDAARTRLLEAGQDDVAAVVDVLASSLREYYAIPKRIGAEAMAEGVARAVPADFSPKPGGKMVVFGDADFASNQLIGFGNNQDLFGNTIAWLIDVESQISERPDADAGKLEMSLLEELLFWLISVILVPLAAFGAALIVIVRRRWL